RPAAGRLGAGSTPIVRARSSPHGPGGRGCRPPRRGRCRGQAGRVAARVRAVRRRARPVPPDAAARLARRRRAARELANERLGPPTRWRLEAVRRPARQLSSCDAGEARCERDPRREGDRPADFTSRPRRGLTGRMDIARRSTVKGTARLLKRLGTAWAALKESYAGLSDPRLTEPGVTGDWSVKDILAHVTTWEREALTHLPLILAGGRPPRYVRYGGIDAFNAKMTDEKRGLSLAEVLRQLDDTHRHLVDFVRRTPEAQSTR